MRFSRLALLHLLFALCLTDLFSAEETRSDFEAMSREYADTLEYDADGRISSVTSWDGSRDEFHYNADGRLRLIESFSKKGKHLESTVFFRDAVDGRLLCFIKGGKGAYFARGEGNEDVFMRTDGDAYSVYRTFFSTLVIPSDDKGADFSYTDDGLLYVVNSDGSESLYDGKGRLVESGGVKYFYGEESEGPECAEEYDGDVLISRTRYNGFFPEETEVFRDGKTVKKIFPSPDGKTEEYYENGLLYARAVFFPDDKRVKSVEYV